MEEKKCRGNKKRELQKWKRYGWVGRATLVVGRKVAGFGSFFMWRVILGFGKAPQQNILSDFAEGTEEIENGITNLIRLIPESKRVIKKNLGGN